MAWFGKGKKSKDGESTASTDSAGADEQPQPVTKIKLNFRGLSNKQITDMASVTLTSGGMDAQQLQDADWVAKQEAQKAAVAAAKRQAERDAMNANDNRPRVPPMPRAPSP